MEPVRTVGNVVATEHVGGVVLQLAGLGIGGVARGLGAHGRLLNILLVLFLGRLHGRQRRRRVLGSRRGGRGGSLVQ